MSALLDSADLYLTKAGGISVTEAATKKVPMIFIHAVAGCEDYNSAFYTQLGCAVKSNDVNELTELCIALVKDENEYDTMAATIESFRLQNASECIFNTLNGE